jgi:hypothetical protein
MILANRSPALYVRKGSIGKTHSRSTWFWPTKLWTFLATDYDKLLSYMYDSVMRLQADLLVLLPGFQNGKDNINKEKGKEQFWPKKGNLCLIQCNKEKLKIRKTDRTVKYMYSTGTLQCQLCDDAFWDWDCDRMGQSKALYVLWEPVKSHQNLSVILCRIWLKWNSQSCWETVQSIMFKWKSSLLMYDHAWYLKNHNVVTKKSQVFFIFLQTIPPSWTSQSRMAPPSSPFCCDVCGKAYQNNSNLNRHRKIHDPSKMKPCPLCGKLFHREDKFKQHMFMAHKQIGGHKIDLALVHAMSDHI